MGRVALVTGGSRGIGRGVATRLAADGALVAVHYATRADAAQQVVAEIAAAGGQAFAVGAPLGGDGDVEALFAALDAELTARTGSTRVDVVVNNAAAGGWGGLAATTRAQFDELMAVNVRAPLFIAQAAAERMGEGGRIVTISSGVTSRATPDLLVYSMTKAAIEGMTRAVAKELAPRGITVNAVAPGVVDTDGSDWIRTSAEARAQAAAMSPFDRVGEPADIADVVAFVASPDARWVTGQVLDATGGSVL